MANPLQADIPLWTRCARELQAELPEQQFNTWIRPLQAVFDGQELRLLAPNHFVVERLQRNHLDRIVALVGPGIEVLVEVGSRDAPVSTRPKIPRKRQENPGPKKNSAYRNPR